MLKEYNKTTTGFVSQKFRRKGNKFICTGQFFVAGDQVDYEDIFGKALGDIEIEQANIGTENECYQPFQMEQPLQDYYILFVWGLVDVQFKGPYTSKSNRDRALKKLKEVEGTEKHHYDTFEVPAGIEIG